MKRKIFLVSFVLILVVAGIVGGVIAAQAAPSGQTTGGQRLVGIGRDGIVGIPPQGNEPYYGFHLNIVVSNPDLNYSKTIEKIVVTNGFTGTLVKEWTVPTEVGLVSPRGVFERDVRQLGIEPPLDTYTFYNFEVYWNGRGETLRGWAEEWQFIVAQDQNSNWYAKDIGQILTKEMVNITR